MISKEIRDKINALRAEQRSLNDACKDDKGNIRLLTEDEQKRYDAIDVECRNLKATLARVDSAVDEPEPAIQSRGVQTAPPGDAPAVKTKPTRPYSILRAIRIGAGEEEMDGLEGEVHQEMVKRSARVGRVYRGIAMPTGNDAETRRMMGRAPLERRDVTTTTVGSSIYVRPEGFIDLLRAQLVIQQLGATFLSDLKGAFALTRQNGTNTLQWVGEGASASPTNFSTDRVTFTPKFAVATQVITREAMMQSSVDLDNMTEDDFAQVIALGVDDAVINGAGGVQPIGLRNNPAIPVYSHAGGNGGPFTYADAVNMETAVSNANAALGRLAYLSNPRMRGSLKQQFVGTAGYPLFIWGKGNSPEIGEINGYPAYATTQVPSNLTAGTSAGNCSAVFYGAWSQLIVAQWDTGLDMVVDPFTQKRAGNIEITSYLSLDTNVRHPEAFIKNLDSTPVY